MPETMQESYIIVDVINDDNVINENNQRQEKTNIQVNPTL